MPRRGQESRSTGSRILTIAQMTLQVGLLILLFTVVLGRFEVRSVSMEPSLEDGQRVVVSKLDHLWPAWLIGQAEAAGAPGASPFAPHAGQIVVFSEGGDSSSPQMVLIKRVIAVPGDTIEIRGGAVRINGRVLDEPYAHGQPTTCSRYCGPLTLGAHQYFVMGDNRTNSWDSRSFGLVSENQIVGEVLLRYWPLAQLRLYF